MTDRVIWKFLLDVTDSQTVEVDGRDVKVLSVGMDPNRQLALWVLATPAEDLISEVEVAIVGTGNPAPLAADVFPFVATVIDGPFAWHVFASANLKYQRPVGSSKGNPE